MNYTVKLEVEQVESIVLNELKTTKRGLISDLNSANSNIFFWDEPEKDKAEIQRHIDAFDIVIGWYNIPGED